MHFVKTLIWQKIGQEKNTFYLLSHQRICFRFNFLKNTKDLI